MVVHRFVRSLKQRIVGFEIRNSCVKLHLKIIKIFWKENITRKPVKLYKPVKFPISTGLVW